MELMNAVEKRRTVRDYLQKKVPFEIIEKALQAGLKAPSYNHQKELFFILVKDMDVRRALTVADGMVEEVSKGFRKTLQEEYEELAREMYLYAIPRQKRMIMSAPEVLLVGYKTMMPIADTRTMNNLNDHAAVWCCIENILLSLAEDDVYGTTMVPENTSGIKKILNIPDSMEVAVMIPFGYKAPDAKIIPQKDVDLKSVLFTDRWR